MKINTYSYPKSSFLSMDKDMNLIVDYFLKNERLKKLLYYTTPDALDKPNLTDEQTFSLFGKNLKIVPKLKAEKDVLNYVIINFDSFSENMNNPEFKDNTIEFDIICHLDQWQLKDFQLRPYKIAAEIDSMLNKQHLTGIGKLYFLGANQMLLSSEFAGLCVMYRAIHGEEDKKDAMNPKDEADIEENFNKMFNE